MGKLVFHEPTLSSSTLAAGFRAWLSLLPILNEAQRRLYVAQKALELGYGGISHLAQLTGVSRPTITKGIKELQADIVAQRARVIRKNGGGA